MSSKPPWPATYKPVRFNFTLDCTLFLTITTWPSRSVISHVPFGSSTMLHGDCNCVASVFVLYCSFGNAACALTENEKSESRVKKEIHCLRGKPLLAWLA